MVSTHGFGLQPASSLGAQQATGGRTRNHVAAIASDTEPMLYSVNLLVRLVVEHEADVGSVPHALEHGVLQAPLVGAVVPLGEVVAAVAALGGRVGLPTQDAAPAVEPGRGGREGNGSQILIPPWAQPHSQTSAEVAEDRMCVASMAGYEARMCVCTPG